MTFRLRHFISCLRRWYWFGADSVNGTEPTVVIGTRIPIRSSPRKRGPSAGSSGFALYAGMSEELLQPVMPALVTGIHVLFGAFQSRRWPEQSLKSATAKRIAPNAPCGGLAVLVRRYALREHGAPRPVRSYARSI